MFICLVHLTTVSATRTEDRWTAKCWVSNGKETMRCGTILTYFRKYPGKQNRRRETAKYFSQDGLALSQHSNPVPTWNALSGSWFQTFAVSWMFYMFFWVSPRRQIVVCGRFGTLCQFHLQRLDVEILKITYKTLSGCFNKLQNRNLMWFWPCIVVNV